MSNICEHPFCSRLIAAECSNHCQLDLCQEHIIEHKNLFVAQYEKVYNNLQKSLNELIHSIEDKKKVFDNNYEKAVSIINENHNNRLNELEQQFQFVHSTQKLIKKKGQLLIDAKNGQTFLYQYDIEQVALYLKEMHKYQYNKTLIETDKKDIEMTSPLNSDTESDSDDSDLSVHLTRNDDVSHFRGRCPLTHRGIYGLTHKHQIRLCSSQKTMPELYLLIHFQRYHHLTRDIAYKLTKAIMNQSDPLTTCIFQPKIDIIDKRYHPITCPLNKLEFSTNCKRTFYKDSLKGHLLHVHHLTVTATKKIMQSFKDQCDSFDTGVDKKESKEPLA